MVSVISKLFNGLKPDDSSSTPNTQNQSWDSYRNDVGSFFDQFDPPSLGPQSFQPWVPGIGASAAGSGNSFGGFPHALGGTTISDAIASGGGNKNSVVAAATTATAPAPTIVSVSGSNLSFDLVWDSSVSSAPSGFMTAVEDAASFYAGNFTTPKATTVTIDVGWGEVMGSTIPAFAVSASSDNGDLLSYNALYTALKAEPQSGDSLLNTYFGSEIPTPAQFQTATGKNPSTADFFVTYSEEQSLGLTPAYSLGQPDGWIGLSSGISWDFSSDASLQAAAGSKNKGGYDAVAAVAGEIGEVLGRIAGLGQTLGLGDGPVYTLLDLSRYSTSKNARDFSSSTAGYFSVTGGKTIPGDPPANLGAYQTASLFSAADLGDWKTTSSVHDAFGYFTSGYNQPMSATDVLETATLGFQLTSLGVSSAKSPTFI